MAGGAERRGAWAVSRWLSDAWVADLGRAVTAVVSSAGGADDATGGVAALAGIVVDVVVTGGSDGDVAFHCRFDGGSVPGIAVGRGTGASVRVSIGSDDAWRLLVGDLTLSSAYMQGRAKVEGPTGAVLELLRASALAPAEAVRAAMAASTER